MSDDDTSPTASQLAANLVLVPCSIGWGLQLLLGALATDRAITLLCKKKDGVPTIVRGRPARWLLIAATGANVAATVVSFWDITIWMTSQKRSTEELNSYRMPDVIAPIVMGLVSTITQIFMAIRCWKIVNRSLLFAALIGGGIATAFAGAIWITVSAARYMHGLADSKAIFVPTQLWLWASLTVDLFVTITLSMHLLALRQTAKADKRADSFIKSIISLAFETWAAPCLLTFISATIYAATWQSDSLWNLYAATSPFIPSLYLLSFVFCLSGTAARKKLLDSSRQRESDMSHGHGRAFYNTYAPRPGTGMSVDWEAPLQWNSLSNHHDSLRTRRDTLPFIGYLPTVGIPEESGPESSPKMSPMHEKTHRHGFEMPKIPVSLQTRGSGRVVVKVEKHVQVEELNDGSC